MALSKTVSYAGTIETVSRKRLQFDPELREIAEGNTRRTEPTGGWIVTATYDVGGDDVQVQATVTQAQLASKTVAQIVAAADALLKALLKV